MIRVELPAHLRILAKVQGEVHLAMDGPVTVRTILDALEAQYPALGGTLRDYGTGQRRPFVRFFACAVFSMRACATLRRCARCVLRTSFSSKGRSHAGQASAAAFANEAPSQ